MKKKQIKIQMNTSEEVSRVSYPRKAAVEVSRRIQQRKSSDAE